MSDRKSLAKRGSIAPSKTAIQIKNLKKKGGSKPSDAFDETEENCNENLETDYDVDFANPSANANNFDSDDSDFENDDSDGDSIASEPSNNDSDASSDSLDSADSDDLRERLKRKKLKKSRASKSPRFITAVSDSDSGQKSSERFSTVEKAEQGMADIIAQLKASHEAKPKKLNTQLKMLSSATDDGEDKNANVVAPPKKIIRKLDPMTLRNRVPKYNRVAYPMASIKPQTNDDVSANAQQQPAVTTSTISPTTATTNKPPKPVATPSQSSNPKVGQRERKVSIKPDSKKNVAVEYVPPPSSGLVYIPISEQVKTPTVQPSSRQSQRPTSAKSTVTAWESHSRRMGYDEYVRSVSRQSADEHKRVVAEVESMEKKAKAAIELAAIQEAKDQEDALAAAEAAIAAQREQNQSIESDLPGFRDSHNFTEEEVDKITGLPPPGVVGRVSIYENTNEGSVDSRKSSVVVRGIPEEGGVGTAASQVSAQNQHILNMASALMNKPSPTTGRYSDRTPAPLRITSPGDVILGRRGSLHAIPTITKLSTSEIDLFTSTTGQFRGGPRDPHFRFLRRNLKGVKLSGPGLTIPATIAEKYYVAEKKKQERAKNDFSSKHSKRIQGAQAMKEHAWAVSRGKYTVGSGTGGFGLDSPTGTSKKEKDEAVNENELRLLKVSNPEKYKRYIEKEKAKAFLLGKWEALEQLRIQIVAKTTSLKHYHSYFQELAKENAILSERHKEVTYKTNNKISNTLERNEDSTLDIIRIDRERKRQYQILQGTFDDFESKADFEIDKLLQKVDMTQKTVDRITLEINKLMVFKSLKESNPTAIANEIKEIKLARDNHIKKRTQELEQIKVDWRTAQSEIEQTWMAKVQTLIDAMGDSLKVHVDTSPSGNYHQNGRLRHEIAVHQAQQAKAQAQIAEMLEKRKVISQVMEKVKDKRRNVLRLKEQMTCSPEMEFEIAPKNLLVKELGI
ncbi:UNVERIFIED_CONTAM: hypothetical protein HDU68_012178 [Siphonaria sp. JEL0065]|nr:hypothetical protein HDU68_012178 [Siphonaria sp. JEL0065]